MPVDPLSDTSRATAPQTRGRRSCSRFRFHDAGDHVRPGRAGYMGSGNARKAYRSGLVIAESVTRDEAKPDIDVTRTGAVPTLKAEIRRPAYGEGMKICFHKRECSWRNLRQNVNRRKGFWISHRGQLKHILDRAASELRPDPIVFTSHILVCRVRPFDA